MWRSLPAPLQLATSDRWFSEICDTSSRPLRKGTDYYINVVPDSGFYYSIVYFGMLDKKEEGVKLISDSKNEVLSRQYLGYTTKRNTWHWYTSWISSFKACNYIPHYKRSGGTVACVCTHYRTPRKIMEYATYMWRGDVWVYGDCDGEAWKRQHCLNWRRQQNPHRSLVSRQWY